MSPLPASKLYQEVAFQAYSLLQATVTRSPSLWTGPPAPLLPGQTTGNARVRRVKSLQAASSFRPY